jgi:hypothetical protein
LIRLSAVLVALLAGWILFTWLDVGAPAIADLEVLQLELADLPEPTVEAVAAASFELRPPPFRFKAPFGVARLKVQIKDPAQASLALFIRRVRDNYMVLVNGQLAAHAPGTLSAEPTLDGIQPRLVRFLPALLQPGENTIDIIAARNTSPPFLREVFLGPAERLEPAYRHAVSMLRDSAEFGAFAARFLSRAPDPDPLDRHGVAAGTARLPVHAPRIRRLALLRRLRQ